MPRLSQWMIRASLLYLGIGFTFGALLLWNKGLPFAGAIWRLRPVHIEMLIFGWMIQFAMGTAFWILPRFSSGNRYGREGYGWLSFSLLNLGVTMAGLAMWWNVATWMLLGRVIVLAGVLAFIRLMWSRVKPIALPSTTTSQAE